MSEIPTEWLKAQAAKLGFNRIGIINARPGRRLDAYHSWLASGYHGEMGYLARADRLARRENLDLILPGVSAIVCVALDYATIQLPDYVAHDPSRGRISNYAWGNDYHDLMTPRLEQLAAWLREALGADVRSKAYVDTGALLERDHAETARLGFTGKNTMLIGPRWGSYFFLGEILTTAPLTPDVPDKSMPTCGTCQRCLQACPTDAFPQPYVLDARRCISYLTIELRGWIPRPLRPLMGNWVYGCDICQVVCPFNRFSISSREPTLAAASIDSAAPPLLDLLALDEAGFEAKFAGSPIRRIKRQGLLRNACVAAGNWGHPQAVPPLESLLSDPVSIVRGHAAWALGQVDNEASRASLRRALEHEADPDVRIELLAALNG